MRLSELINIYIAKRSGVHWKTKNSIRSNTSTLMVFLAALKADPILEDVDDRLVLTVINSRWTQGNSTYPQAYGRIRTFLRWASSRGYPLGEIEGITEVTVSVPDLEKVYLTYPEMLRTVKVAKERKNYRDAGVVEFAYWSHRREAEIFGMKRKDVDFSPRPGAPHGVYWFTETKASKGRQMLDLLEEEANCLKEWLDQYEQAIGEEVPPMAYLFPARYACGKSVKGEGRPTKLLPFVGVTAQSDVFALAYRAAGVYEKRKAGHAARRGGEEDTWVALNEAGVDDPVGVIMERSKQSRSTVELYLNRKASAERSRKAYTLISQKRKEAQEPTEVDTRDEEGQTGARVIRLFPRVTA